MGRLATAVMIATCVFVCVTDAGRARELALLIGVSAYDSREFVAPLHGPRNDVTIMWRLLKDQGFKDEDVVVLADGLPVTKDYPRINGRPTRAAIVQAFVDLAKRAGKDDFVYIHISSHGSEQPVQPGKGAQQQPGGLNQVMLPIDVERSKDAKTIFHGLPDYEIGKLLDAVRAKAGRVWIVIDMCHAGDATRGNLVARRVDPAALGIAWPSDGFVRDVGARGGSSADADHALVDATAKPGLAPMVAFFAVGPRDLSYERPFPGYAPPLVTRDGLEDRLGAFTYLVHRALRNVSGKTYRDLRNEVVSALDSGAAGSGMPIPMFQGDLDQPVFGTNPLDVRKGWPAHYHAGQLDVAAGAVHGLTPGSVVVVHRGASDKASEMGRATVVSAQAATSRAKFQAAGGAPDLTSARNADADVWVTIVEEAVSFVYKISVPPAGDRSSDKAAVALAAIELLKKDRINKDAIAADWLVADSPLADFRLRIRDGSIWITSATGVLNTAVGDPRSAPRISITDAAETTDKLFNALWSLARAENLVRLASRYGTSGLFSVSADWYAPGSERPDVHRACPEQSRYDDLLRYRGKPIGGGEPSQLTHCDLVAIRLQNSGSAFVDAAVLYVDARGGVQTMATLSGSDWIDDSCSIALPPKAGSPTVAAINVVLWKNGEPSTAGTEHVVVVAAERPVGGAQTCFNALTQSTLDGARGSPQAGERSTGSQSAFQSLLESAALAKPGVRGPGDSFASRRLDKSAMAVYTFDVSANPIRAVSGMKGRSHP